MSDHVEVVKSKLSPVLPAELHGFSVTVGLGVYPADQPASHRRAVYAELWPITAANQEKLRRINRQRILATVPLTAHAAAVIKNDPDGELAEQVGLRAVAEAARLAKTVNDA